MNYGIIQNRRHDKKRDGAPSPLLQDARLREMAKQMGIDAKELSGESAASVWQLLNDMATNDPSAYQRFVAEQLQNGPPAPATSSSQQTDEVSDRSVDNSSDKKAAASPPLVLPRYFSPYPGFVVKCAMFHTVKCQQQESKLFLNCCAHELVDAPKNPNSGKDVPDDTHAVPSTSNLEVPLIVGKVREIRDAADAVCCACDVVFHPWVMRRCEWDANFKREVMKLAIHWVQRDVNVRLVHQGGKFIKSRYKGGDSSGTVANAGVDIVTAKFLVEPPSMRADANSSSDRSSSGSDKHGRAASAAAPSSASMVSPSELLKQVRLTRNEEDAEPTLVHDFVIKPAARDPSTSTTNVSVSNAALSTPPPAPTRANKLIEEVDSTPSIPSAPTKPSNQNTVTRPPSKQAAGTGAVKKGFLLSSSSGKAKKALYPTGSSEGRATSAYVNLLSRSKVVDLGEVERQKQQQDAERRKLLGDDLAFLGSTNNSNANSQHRTSTASGTSNEVDYGDMEFEQLCMDADPELNPAAARRQQSQNSDDDPVRQLFGNGLDDISKLFNL